MRSLERITPCAINHVRFNRITVLLIHFKDIIIYFSFFFFSSEPITGEGRWPDEPPFVAPPPEEEVGASLGSALVTVAGSLAISFAVHVGCSVGYWALKRGWAWRKLNVNV